MFLKISYYSQENTCVGALKVEGMYFIKNKLLTQVFSGEYFEIFKKRFLLKRSLLTGVKFYFNRFLNGHMLICKTKIVTENAK